MTKKKNKAVEFLKLVFLNKRMKSLYWRISAMIVAELVLVLPDVFTSFEVPQYVIIGVGLVLAEITKYLNNKKA